MQFSEGADIKPPRSYYTSLGASFYLILGISIPIKQIQAVSYLSK